MRGTVSDPQMELARLTAVRRYEILDSPPDGAFDRITTLAARLLGVPIAIVSIVDADRIWFKSSYGLGVEQIGRDPGLCSSAILDYEPTVIPDARLDPVALSNPLVAGDFGLRFYAAVPLTMDDRHNLGTLCVIDHEPRTLKEDELQVLRDLGQLVVHELEVRLQARKAVAAEVRLRQEAMAAKADIEALAATLQSSLLPPRLPKIPGVEVDGYFRPADRSQVGGDFYDIFALHSGAWGVVIGDVSGKGPDAAAVTAAARYALRAAAMEHDSPAAVLALVNESLLIDAEPGSRLCTVLYARLRVVGGNALDVELASAGHPLPQILRAAGEVQEIGTPGTLLGVLSHPVFDDAHTTLSVGDTLVVFTDGLTDAFEGSDGERRLGAEGVQRLLAACRGLDLGATMGCLEEAATNTRDDLAIVAVRPSA